MSGLPVKQIKAILDAAGVNYSDCSEKCELEERLAQLRANPSMGKGNRQSPGGSAGQGRSPAPDRPSATTANPSSLGRDTDNGSDGGEAGGEIRRICACECYYQVLGVPKTVDDAELKKAYRKTALKLHPDKCSLTGADEAFKKVSSAYACLSDAEKRRCYNTWGTEDKSKMGANGFRGGGGGDVDAEELFRAFFGAAAAGASSGCGSGVNHGAAAGLPGGDPLAFIANMATILANNPWTLLTALVVVSSAVSLVSLLLARPYLLVLPFVIPADMRKPAGMILFGLLASGILI